MLEAVGQRAHGANCICRYGHEHTQGKRGGGCRMGYGRYGQNSYVLYGKDGQTTGEEYVHDHEYTQGEEWGGGYSKWSTVDRGTLYRV